MISNIGQMAEYQENQGHKGKTVIFDLFTLRLYSPFDETFDSGK